METWWQGFLMLGWSILSRKAVLNSTGAQSLSQLPAEITGSAGVLSLLPHVLLESPSESTWDFLQ
jgi:hypothetical protein